MEEMGLPTFEASDLEEVRYYSLCAIEFMKFWYFEINATLLSLL